MLLKKESFHVAKAASDDATRYGLTGILVEPDGSTVGTDGHILLKYSPKNVPEQTEYPMIDGFSDASDTTPLVPFILPKADALAIAKMPEKSRHLPILQYVALDVPRTNANGNAYFTSTNLETVTQVAPKKIDGRFPEYDRVIPAKERGGITIGFTLSVLEKALATMKACGVTVFSMNVVDATAPVRIDAECSDYDGTVVGVVMPRHL